MKHSNLCFIKTIFLVGGLLFSCQVFGDPTDPGLLFPASNWKSKVTLLRDQGVRVDVHEIEVLGLTKSVVVLGESHIKDTDTKALERQLIDLFPLRLIEDYLGTDPQFGRISEMVDQVAISLGEWIASASIYSSGGTPTTSSLWYADKGGFDVLLDGRVVFNECVLGLVNLNGFHYHQSNIEKLISSSPELNLGLFFKNLSQFSSSVQAMRTLINADHLPHYRRENFCTPRTSLPSPNILSISMGFGDLSIWSDVRTYGSWIGPSEQLMVESPTGLNWNPRYYELRYPKEGQQLVRKLAPSRRDLRMVDSIYAALNAFKGVPALLVLVGNNHRLVFKDLIPNWKEQREFFLNQE